MKDTGTPSFFQPSAQTEVPGAEGVPACVKMLRYFHPDGGASARDFDNLMKIAATIPEGHAVLEKMAAYQEKRAEKRKPCFHFTARAAGGINVARRQIYTDSFLMRRNGDKPTLENKEGAARLIREMTYALAAADMRAKGQNIDSPEAKAELTAQANANYKIMEYRLGFVPPGDLKEKDRKSAGDSAVFYAMLLEQEREIQKKPHQMFLHAVRFLDRENPAETQLARSNLDVALYMIENSGAGRKALERLAGAGIREKEYTYKGEMKNTASVSLNLSASSEEIALEILQRAAERRNVMEGRPQHQDVLREKFAFVAENPNFEKAVIADSDYRAFKKAIAAGLTTDRALALAEEARKAAEQAPRRVLQQAFAQTKEGTDNPANQEKFEKVLKILEMTEDGRALLEAISERNCAIRFDASCLGEKSVGMYNSDANVICLRPMGTPAQMAGVLRHEGEHMLQAFRTDYGRMDALSGLACQRAVEAGACAAEAAFNYEINPYFPESFSYHPCICQSYAAEMQESHDREKAWGKAFKAWNSENLAAVYEGEHMLFAGFIGHDRSRDKTPLSGEDILRIVHPEKGCTVEPDFLFSPPLCTGSLENVVNVLNRVIMISEETRTPADASALKISVDEKRAAPEFIPLYEGMAAVIQNSADAGKPVGRAEMKKLHKLISDFHKQRQSTENAEKPKTESVSSANRTSPLLSTALLKRKYGR